MKDWKKIKQDLILFLKTEVEKAGLKKDWIFTNNTYKSELLYQLIKPFNES